MVLSAPTPPHSQDKAERGWIEQLLGTLELVRRGTLLLVDHARPEALGTLVRGLAGVFPDVEVHTRAADVLGAEEGSTVVWFPDARDAERANLERPVFSDRALKVVLFSPKRVSDIYARRAPDFFSWITRYVECPALPSGPAVRGLTMASNSTESLGIRWTRGDLDPAFAQAFPADVLVRQSADLAYDEMVKLCAETAEWIAWLDVDGPYRLRRIAWAAAEARRRGRLILDRPTVASPGFWPVSGHLIGVAEARDLLRRAGAIHPGRLAALLDFEPEAIRLAAAWLRTGGGAEELEARVLKVEDGGAEAARMALDRGVAHQRPTPPVLRAKGGTILWIPEDRVREKLAAPAEQRGPWAALAEEALDAGDPRVGLFWAQRSVTDSSTTSDAWIAVSRALFARGLTRDALSFLERIVQEPRQQGEGVGDERARVALAVFRARLRMSTVEDAAFLQDFVSGMRVRGPRTAQLVQILQAVGLISSQSGDSAMAFQTLQEALRIEKNLTSSERKKLLTSRHGLAMILKERGALREAEAMARHALDDTRNRFGDEHPHVATCLQGLGTVLAARGDASGARKYLDDALALKQRLYGDEHPSTASTYHELGKVAIALGDFEQAEAYLKAARVCRLHSLGEASPELAETLDVLGRLRRKQGLHSEAEALLRQSTEIRAIALGPAHPETLESVQGLSQVASDQAERQPSIQGFLEDLPRRTRYGSKGVPFAQPMMYLHLARLALRLPRSIAELERSGSLAAAVAKASRWLLRPSAAFSDLAVYLSEGSGDSAPDRGRHKAAVMNAIETVIRAILVSAAGRPTSEALCGVAIERVRAAFGHDHPFTRDVEEALGQPSATPESRPANADQKTR